MSNYILDLFGLQRKSFTSEPMPVMRRSEEYVEDRIANEDINGYVSVAYACATVISEGLAIPPMYLQQITSKGRSFATNHSLYPLVNSAPNALQTSYEFRETMGWQAATVGDAYAWLNRSKRGEILEIVPLKPTEISRVDPVAVGALPTFTLGGRAVANADIWHFRGRSHDRHGGVNMMNAAQSAIMLASVAESFGVDLFKNRAALEGIISPEGNLDAAGFEKLKESFAKRHTTPGQKGKTAFFPVDIKYTPVSATATDAQWLETRRYQVEEICRYFRVSPTKVFSTLGSQSYNSVEQAHIAHDADTDAHWHERFAQSATKALLSDQERAKGFAVVIDNRAALRGTAMERATYYNAGISGGWMTRNEAREAEGYDRSSDPEADKLTPAANLFGPTTSEGTPDTPSE
ncbi:phage portal protein [Sphingomonas sp. HITSZ_GF]|uniref:phage portal protein n=1 Tax=Sphingomonas sp. HITSZ_GF TaxID=3037247 RepID=UPI00240D9D19|nr:phage portal protein [Sphingomonas sp. HITSZ_GF]MDG2532064.1 phage portal protein [Sphingomonas sp. HITSZ_GF]